MEKKSIQRMIGIFVLVALVAIALPFFFSKNDSSTQVATAPPLPDQQSNDPLAANTNQMSVVDATNQNQATPAPAQQQAAASPLPLADAVSTPAPVEKKTVATEMKVLETVQPTHSSIHHKKLVALSKQAAAAKIAWVVQMGSFRNKDNARRLTDRLRAGGFKAFSKTVRSGTHESVRVFIGPESKQALADEMSDRAANYVKIKGVVIPYKPLTL